MVSHVRDSLIRSCNSGLWMKKAELQIFQQRSFVKTLRSLVEVKRKLLILSPGLAFEVAEVP